MNEPTSNYLLPAERLPLFAKIALLRLADRPEQRTGPALRSLLADLARTYSDHANARIIDSCTFICRGLYGASNFPMQMDHEESGWAA